MNPEPTSDRHSTRRPARIATTVGLAALALTGGAFLIDLLAAAAGDPKSDAAAIVRELGGVLLSVIVVGMSAASLFSDAISHGNKPGRTALRGSWLVAFRWLVWIALLSLVFQLTFVDPRLPAASGAALWILVATLMLFNVTLTIRSRNPNTAADTSAMMVVVDTATLMGALQVTGGVLNPLAALFVVQAVLAALLLEAPNAKRAVIGITIAAAFLTFVDVSGLARPLCIDFNAASCLIRDRLSVAATGLALTIMTFGAGMVVHAVRARFDDEQVALAASISARRREAVELADTGKRLQEERGRLDAVLDCIADAIVFADPNGKIVLRNRASAALWPGRNHAPADDLKVCHDPSMWDEVFHRLSDPKKLEHHPLLRVGDRLFEATWGRVSERGDGRLLGAVMVARDVTERMQEQGMRAQRDRMATLGTIAAALAHEVNNPLSSIQLYTQHAIKALAGHPQLVEHMETIQRNADVCKRIMRDLLTYARQRPPDKKPLPANGLIQLTVKMVQPLAEQHGVAISVDDVSLGTLINADRDQIVQILVNFALNGIEAMRTNPEGRERTLHLKAAKHSDHEIGLTVTDTGPGIPPSDRDLVFSPFFTTRAEGTGLGLAVSQDIARAHGGHIELNTAAHGGASLTLVIPAYSLMVRAAAVTL